MLGPAEQDAACAAQVDLRLNLARARVRRQRLFLDAQAAGAPQPGVAEQVAEQDMLIRFYADALGEPVGDLPALEGK